jgi:hypothetical protein
MEGPKKRHGGHRRSVFCLISFGQHEIFPDHFFVIVLASFTLIQKIADCRAIFA